MARLRAVWERLFDAKTQMLWRESFLPKTNQPSTAKLAGRTTKETKRQIQNCLFVNIYQAQFLLRGLTFNLSAHCQQIFQMSKQINFF